MPLAGLVSNVDQDRFKCGSALGEEVINETNELLVLNYFYYYVIIYIIMNYY